MGTHPSSWRLQPRPVPLCTGSRRHLWVSGRPLDLGPGRHTGCVPAVATGSCCGCDWGSGLARGHCPWEARSESLGEGPGTLWPVHGGPPRAWPSGGVSALGHVSSGTRQGHAQVSWRLGALHLPEARGFAGIVPVGLERAGVARGPGCGAEGGPSGTQLWPWPWARTQQRPPGAQPRQPPLSRRLELKCLLC